uniref:ZP domain-containing protein n=1 Tax=Caenorhabditis tropicalis TaxID=1561998 RepID=A0A1I7UJA7_9PELO
MARLLCLLLLFSVYSNALVNFCFTGQLLCPLENFRYQIYMFEDDLMVDNLLSRTPVTTSHYPHYYVVTGQDTHDGCVVTWPVLFLCDYFFEIYFGIIHNCSLDGKWRTFDINMGKHYKVEGLVNKTININLTNVGKLAIDQRDPV